MVCYSAISKKVDLHLRNSLGGIADERIGLVERGIMRRIARELGLETLGFRARRCFATEHPRIRRSITLDRDGGVGLARIASESS